MIEMMAKNVDWTTSVITWVLFIVFYGRIKYWLVTLGLGGGFHNVMPGVMLALLGEKCGLNLFATSIVIFVRTVGLEL